MKEWFTLATRPSVVRRALKYAVVVGAVLIAINHGNALLRGEVDLVRIGRMGLTVLVPYLVSDTFQCRRHARIELLPSS